MAKKKREFASMTELMEFFKRTGREGGKVGGKIAAQNMSKAARIARAKKAAKASAKVRRAKAKEKEARKRNEPIRRPSTQS
jgi:hypothetical protein